MVTVGNTSHNYFLKTSTMVTLKYPRGWSFGATDNVVKVEKQIYRLDRDIYIQARTYSEGPANG